MDNVVKEEVAVITKRVCETFTIQYTQAYVVELVNLVKRNSQPHINPYLLDARPSWNAALKKGWLIKEGAINRSWKKRWVVVHSSYLVDYYDNDQQILKGKKGTMDLAGYTVVEDPNLAALARLKKLAEKMGVDFRNIPKPKEYPPLVFELYHPHRRCYYLKASNHDEFRDWTTQFKSICWNVEGLTITDECHKIAFPLAVRNTRWALGRWSVYHFGGAEEQVLSDIITDEVDAEVMGRVYTKMSGPWFVRNTLRGQLLKTIDSTITGIVRPTWNGVARAITLLRPKLEPSIRALLVPFFEFEQKFNGYMSENAMTIIDPIVQEHVAPHVAKIANIFKAPLEQAFLEVEEVFAHLVEQWKPLEDFSESFKELDYFPRGHYDMKTIITILNSIYEPLWALNLTFKEISPWILIWKAHALVRKVADNLVWTWEQMIVNRSAHTSAGSNALLWTKSLLKYAKEAKDEVLLKFKSDVAVATAIFLKEIVLAIVLPPFQFDLVPLSSKILEPLIETIPEQLLEFCDLKQMFEQFYTSQVEECINKGLEKILPAPPNLSYLSFSKDLESFKTLPSPSLSQQDAKSLPFIPPLSPSPSQYSPKSLPQIPPLSPSPHLSLRKPLPSTPTILDF